METLEGYFYPFRDDIVGLRQTFHSPYGVQPIIYSDWAASGRLYHPIEDRLLKAFGPYVGNPHSESSATGAAMTVAYQEARGMIKRHVNAGPDDILLTGSSGMTGLVNKFQRILGLKAPQGLRQRIGLRESERPVVFVTHMEHHSNHTSWYETIAEVKVIPPDENGIVDLNTLREMLFEHRDRPLKIGSFTACSNVTGVFTPYHELARIVHEHEGYVFIDFAAAAPYAAINMHPPDPAESLDAVMFSPHKFLGGPGSSGVLLFNRNLYRNTVPDDAGGGTVAWTNPWGDYMFLDDVEVREDGGTPGFLQAFKAALAIQLKESMGIDRIHQREAEIVTRALKGLCAIPGVHVFAGNIDHRLAMLSFVAEGIHYNLMVRLLNDRYGIQSRGGCSCAGTYGHYLLDVDAPDSRRITDKIAEGDLSDKPGWVRLSFHPTSTDEEIDQCIFAVGEIVNNIATWKNDYSYCPKTNEYASLHADSRSDHEERNRIRSWFTL
jgi:selenocysteine lyase/cysteine desulfurase